MKVALLSAALRVELPLAANNAPPTEFRILKRGLNETIDDEPYLFDDDAAEGVLKEAARYGNDLVLDYGHGMFSQLVLDPAEAGKAAGWYHLEVRNGELWAAGVRWTDRAAAHLSAKEYRYISPTFHYSQDERRVSRLLNVALTNVPRLTHLQPLMAAAQVTTPAEEKNMAATINLATLVAALSMKADANENEVLTALASQRQQQAEMLALCGATTIGEALGKVKGLQEKAAMAEQLAQQVASAQLAQRKVEVDSLVAKAVSERKVAPAEVARLTQLGHKDFEFLKGYLEERMAAPSMLPAPAGQPAAGATGSASLSQVELDVARMMGQSAEEFAKAKARGPVVVGRLVPPVETPAPKA